jgi:hypothetical protein
VDLVARAGFADLVRSVAQSGATLVFATLRPGASGQAAYISVDVNMLPMLSACRSMRRWWRPRTSPSVAPAVIGYAAMMPVVAWGFSPISKNVAITAGPLIASQTGLVLWQREAIAFAYQQHADSPDRGPGSPLGADAPRVSSDEGRHHLTL